MRYRIIFKLKSITHAGAHIGRDIGINITSSLGIAFTAQKRVLPDQITNFDVKIGRMSSDANSLSLPISVTITEHDAVFNDIGTDQQTLKLDLANEKTRVDTMVIYVTERRWFFWKATAKFSVIIETLVEDIPPKMRVPTVDDPRWTGDFNDDNETVLLARVIFGEARDERLSDVARIAVGWSIRNRVEYKNALRYGGAYHAVILKPKQYSSFNANDKNKYLVENPLANENDVDTRAWKNCYNIAADILSNRNVDPTGGANHFFDDSIWSAPWAKQEYFKIKIDSFLFYDIP